MNPPRASDRSGAALSAEDFDLLTRAHAALASLPVATPSDPHADAIGLAVESGAAVARAVLETAGVVQVGQYLMSAATTFHSNGHASHAEAVERLAFLIVAWERRSGGRHQIQ